MTKKFILNADDFGLSKNFNRAVLYGNNKGILTSASLCANGSEFDSAVNEVLPECADLGIGVHLNIIEGYSLTDCPLLTDKKGRFNKGFIQHLVNSRSRKFLEQVEQEFRAQIEKVQKHAQIDHVDSHVHVHAIPEIFKITCRLAKEYKIKYVRTQYEEMYHTPGIFRHINLKYPLNIIKIVLLNHFTQQNKNILKEYGLKTNDFIIGVGYTGLMDTKTTEYGLKILEDDCIVEALIHPCCYSTPVKNRHYTEFQITQSRELEDKIKQMGCELTNYKKLQ